MQEYPQNEKRNFRRFYSSQPVGLQFKDPNQYGGSLSCDLSEGGIRVRLNDFIPLDTEMILQIQLADRSVVECPCRVVWVEKDRFGDRYKAGLEFLQTDSMLDSRKKIHGFLSCQK